MEAAQVRAIEQAPGTEPERQLDGRTFAVTYRAPGFSTTETELPEGASAEAAPVLSNVTRFIPAAPSVGGVGQTASQQREQTLMLCADELPDVKIVAGKRQVPVSLGQFKYLNDEQRIMLMGSEI